jgi:RNA 3'-terminal phosphate cyclase (ATP)
MITIDGGQKSGSGTIVRYATAFAALLGEPVRVVNARAKRLKPGLRPQHLSSVLACAELCEGTTQGAAVGSTDFTFRPGKRIRGGSFAWDIGTAGSTTMLALSILPLACFAEGPVTAQITGGVFQDFAPSPYHMQHVLAPFLRHMGVTVELRVLRAGYVPQGSGVLQLTVQPARPGLQPLIRMEQGPIRWITGVAFASHLEERCVSERMASTCEERFSAAGHGATIERVADTTALHAGASLTAWTETATGCVLGADRAGALRRSAESIGRFVAATLLEDLSTGATLDRHTADQLILFAALAHGVSHYRAPRHTDHIGSNLWLVKQFGARGQMEQRDIVIEGIRLRRSAARLVSAG